MRRCPKCATEYFDDMVEFCLEDGAKLHSVSKFEDDAPTITKQNKPLPFTEKTLNLPSAPAASKFDTKRQNDAPTTLQNNIQDSVSTSGGVKVLEITPMVIALLHNWWQWLYISNQYISSISSFLISANFLMWLLLLTTGAAAGLLTIKRSRNKGFAIAGLIILAVNLILFLVPKR